MRTNLRRLAGLLLLCGGVSGVWLAGLILRGADLEGEERLRTLVLGAYMLAGVAAGIELLRGSRAGPWLGAGFLLPQLVAVSSPAGSYFLAAPLGLVPLVGRAGLQVLWEAGAGWTIGGEIGGQGDLGLGPNLAALALLWLVQRTAARTGSPGTTREGSRPG